jgi:transcriptional regulator with XRE-family HTH domain
MAQSELAGDRKSGRGNDAATLTQRSNNIVMLHKDGVCNLDTIDKILKLMSDRDVNAAMLTREAGITRGLITQWKQRRQLPSAANIAKIAAYFGISVDELMGIENPATPEGEQPEPTEHQRLVRQITELTADKSVAALKAIIGMIEHIESKSSK